MQGAVKSSRISYVKNLILEKKIYSYYEKINWQTSVRKHAFIPEDTLVISSSYEYILNIYSTKRNVSSINEIEDLKKECIALLVSFLHQW